MKLPAEAQARLDLLRTAPLDRWIAVSADETRIVGEGVTFEDAVRAAEKSGEDDPLLIHIPPDWEPRIL